MYDVCHIYAACRVEYETENNQISNLYFNTVKIHQVSPCKPKKCTMYVTFLLGAE